MSTSQYLAAVLAFASFVVVGTRVAAQVPAQNRDAALRVTVSDQTGAVIVGATVTALPVDPQGKPIELTTNERGEAVFTNLWPGRYDLHAEYPGFEPRLVDDLRLRPGSNTRRDMKLNIAKIAEDVVVGQDPRDRALDPRGNSFGNLLTREQIEALPDDPDEMEEALKQMGGPGAVLRVDGFRGGRLPPKSQIQSIRFRRDLFAAENHGGGMVHIDITTRPGGGPLRGTLDFTFRDDALNARNAFAPALGPERQHAATFTLNGTLWKERTGFSFTSNGLDAYDSKTLLAAVPEGTVSGVVRRPTDRIGFSARVDHALTRSHALRATYSRSGAESRNLGVGDFDLPSRAYARDTTEDLFRLSVSGPVRRDFFNETRFQVRRTTSESNAFSDAAAVLVLDAFNTGGAQVAGGRRALDFEFASDIDYAKGRHSARAGFLFEGGFYRSDDVRNAGGTFTFPSLEAYEAAEPTTFTRRSGDPLVEYSQAQLGWYVQDDIRVARSLSVSVGLRHELQTHVDDYLNVAPRLGATWSPFKSGATTLRGGAGVFYDWYDAQVYEQTLRVDGVHQIDEVVRNPGYPNPLIGPDVIVLPSGRLVQADGLRLPTTFRAFVGVEQVLSPLVRANMSFMHGRGRYLFRGRNTNAPLADGNRPDPASGNITEVESSGGSEGNMLNTGFSLNLPWHRTFLFVNYGFGRLENDTDGAFALPANNYDLAAEWGASLNDVRHRLSGMMNMNLWKGFKLATSFNASSGQPYNITTGFDDNGDTVSNDRPDGVGRNAGRMKARWDVGARLSWSFGFGQRKGADGAAGTPMIMVRTVGGGETPMGGFTGGADEKRWRFEVYLAGTNVFNHMNPVAYSGVMTSPFFGQPTSAGAPRKMELGARFSF